MSDSAAIVQKFEFEYTLGATIERAWQAFMFELSAWWPRDAFSSDETLEMVLEPCLGGKLYEDSGNAQGTLWYSVISISEPTRVELRGDVSPRFGGPAQLMLTLEFLADPKGCKLKVTDAGVGAARSESEFKEGWDLIFGALVEYCEGRTG
ncbi:MAG: SRPBCC domain-containing protein [Chthonomonas sp.]|nr:SRPBCC domain-containing protein [Chthonomonas sp.]